MGESTPTSTRSPHEDVRVQWGVKIPLRDGVRLHATVYLPKQQREAGPAIVTLLPYIAQIYHDQGIYFAAHGYAFLIVDVRGRGNSEGEFRPNINESKDGYDVVEWTAAQSYCNGQVAMWGGSYMGYAQWAAAREFPPHLATIVPVSSPYFGVDFPGRNNIPGPYLVQWLSLVAGRTSQERIFADQGFWRQRFKQWFQSGAPFKELDTLVGLPSATFQEWISHPEHDEYWNAYNPTAAQYAELSIPILTITGAYDSDQPGALHHYRQHLKHCSAAAGALHYLIIGPWDHAGTRTPQQAFGGVLVGPASLLDLPKLHREWYDWILQKGAKPEFLKKNVAYYVIGADEWRYADTLEDATVRGDSYYLHSVGNPVDVFQSGALVPAPQASGAPHEYCYDPRDVSLAELESTIDPTSRVDQRLVLAASGGQLVYHSEPFKHDTQITGFFELSLWLSIDQPDTDFRAAVYEIDSNGGSLLLAADRMRARYRCDNRQPRLITSSEPQLYEFAAFTFVSRVIRSGSRIRLTVGPVNSIHSEKNYNSGGIVAEESMQDAHPVLVRLFHGTSYPSVLRLPIGREP